MIDEGELEILRRKTTDVRGIARSHGLTTLQGDTFGRKEEQLVVAGNQARSYRTEIFRHN